MSDENQIKQKITQLDELYAQLDLTNIAKQNAIAKAIPVEVKIELDAIEAEFGDQADMINSAIGVIEAEIKAGVVTLGQSIKAGRFMAVFNRGRVTWDTKKLEGFALAHPEIAALRKEGEPFVVIKKA